MRDAFVSINSDGLYCITLRESQEIKKHVVANTYHEIGGIIANWLDGQS